MNGEKMEEMLSQLIKMVGTIQADQQEMKQDMEEMKRDMQEMKQDQQEMKQDQLKTQNKLQDIEIKQKEHHKELVDRLKAIENDQQILSQ
ncbi:hypothetical protein [Bacillus sp. B15-48]|uniref:hypothetical protein n=1 Tax=Bacillus sp. B15-48 TaxID=1548601 RepID=UPI00193EDFE1|nr:hypothetical protein [Bacillus sp. B15-48]MBM4761347.1 hypothetical protein [Bacillus sp. B15-48]